MAVHLSGTKAVKLMLHPRQHHRGWKQTSGQNELFRWVIDKGRQPGGHGYLFLLIFLSSAAFFFGFNNTSPSWKIQYLILEWVERNVDVMFNKMEN